MGSGCDNSCGNFFEKKTPDTQVIYTGPAIPALGICTNDRLDEVEAVLLQKILDYSTGKGINIPDIDLTTCEAFASCITCCDNCTDLPCLLECYKNAICELWNLVQDAMAGPYDVKCLTGVTGNSTLKQIIQQLITQFCQLSAVVAALQIQVNGIQTQVTNINNNLTTNIGNFLLSHITSCSGTGNVIKTGNGASANIEFKGFTPPGGVIAYKGRTTGLFDSAGLGLANTPMCGWALCNGNTHVVNNVTYVTTDMRELTPTGAGAGVMGGPGTLPSNAPGSNYAAGQLIGSATVTLTASQSGMPAHGHNAYDNGHSHGYKRTPNPGGTPPLGPATANNNRLRLDAIDDNTSTGYANIVVSNASAQNASESHPNIQPSRALIFIERLY